MAIFAMIGSVVEAKPSVKTKTVYYDVYASTSRQLKSQMRLHGPKGFWGLTSWYIRWTADCKVSLRVTYTMPKWVNKELAPKGLQRHWDAMMERLWLHERGHGRYANLAAREIVKVGCRDARRILRKLRRQNKAYDRRTKHGRTQGVRLP